MVQRVAPGNPLAILARDWNDVGEATEIVLNARVLDGPSKKQWIHHLDTMICRNDTADRREGDVLEAGDYLLTTVDPMSPWFVGQAPTSPVRESTHGVLRAACKSGKMQRVQVAGCVKAWVNVTKTTHNFCDASAGSHVLHSNSIGPHKIIQKPTGTGELECFILLYAAGDGYELAEAYMNEELCPSDFGGTGTGSSTQTVSVINARLVPNCLAFTPTRVVNDCNHHAPIGSLVKMYRRFCADGQEEWVIYDVELRRLCPVTGVEDRDACLVGWGVRIGAEWCQLGEPTEACVIVEYYDCEDPLPECDTSLVWDPLYACCYVGGSGWGSGSQGPV